MTTTSSDASVMLVTQLHRLADHISMHDLPAPITTRINTARSILNDLQSTIELQLWARTSGEIASALVSWADALVDPVCTARIVTGYRGATSLHVHVIGRIMGETTVDVMAVDGLHGRYAGVDVGQTVPVPLETLKSWAVDGYE